jgi:hypothetical protein
MSWVPISFGKHSGLTLPQILFKDPDWFFWAIEKGALAKHGYAAEAERIDVLARNIRIPPDSSGALRVAEYYVHPSGGIARMKFVPPRRPLHQGSSAAFRKDRIDLSVARQVRGGGMDKTGAELLLQDMKAVLFGAKARMTRKRCEAFFDDPLNFVG